ncbi:CPBP family intramembrane metalloprotease [Segetibacter sp. 3557_3]|uniref:CPBP family intramembrane glutamic endopeptidase n=1 Tax=Segetibacter sp. 3557_3 TaxID=2547429 RepID=UPI001058FAF6|nr:CPBP family intramembrane glutamic endopeptidase [Segetibacter sp. 3557_3]TDH18358.1 CPBP family intramembrane metalloprotease [Segetibacter sp. 3557_3]
MNTYLKYKSPGNQFGIFISLSLGFLLLTSYATMLFFPDIGEILVNKNATSSPHLISRLKWAQLVSATLSFVVPALLFGYFSSPKPLRYVGLYPRFSGSLILLAVVLLIAVQPLAGWLGMLNSKVHFGSIHQQLQQAEATYNQSMQTFLYMKQPSDLVVNLFMMALLPAIGEELFFRGALQNVLLRMSKKPWVAIFLSSLIFALLHGTFFKFLPIFALGVMLGTVYFVTRNLWYTVIIHFLNNAIAVFAVYYQHKSVTLKQFADDKLTAPFYLVLASLAITIAIIYYMKQKSETVLPVLMTEEEQGDFHTI